MTAHNNIILCGFMGTGKSTVGRIVSKEFGYSFIDTDNMIQKDRGKNILQIFEEDGEETFRILERDYLINLAPVTKTIIATGGGMIMQPDNFTRLLNMGMMILLTASPETIYNRLFKLGNRPLLNSENPLEKIKRILKKRNEIYIQIKHKINTDLLSVTEVSQSVIEIFNG